MSSVSFVATRDFNAAARLLRVETAHLNRVLWTSDQPAFVPSVPDFNPDDWYDGDNNNCTSFALNRNAGAIDPGMIGGAQPDPAQYRDDPRPGYMHRFHLDCLRDGLVYLGDRFLNCPAGHFPVGLFHADDRCPGDYHWMALRRAFFEKTNPQSGRLLWTHKMGDMDAEFCESPCDTIFTVADRIEYPVFAGYYAAPVSLAKEKPPRPVRAGVSYLF